MANVFINIFNTASRRETIIRSQQMSYKAIFDRFSAEKRHYKYNKWLNSSLKCLNPEYNQNTYPIYCFMSRLFLCLYHRLLIYLNNK